MRNVSFVVYKNFDGIVQLFLEAALQRCSEEKLFRKYTANLQENPHAQVLFQ